MLEKPKTLEQVLEDSWCELAIHRFGIQANAVRQFLAEIPPSEFGAFFGMVDGPGVVAGPEEPDWDSLFEANREANIEADFRAAEAQLGAQD